MGVAIAAGGDVSNGTGPLDGWSDKATMAMNPAIANVATVLPITSLES